MKRPLRFFCFLVLLVAALTGHSAWATKYTVTATGTFQSGSVTSNFSGGTLFGLAGYPQASVLTGMPATVVFTIDDMLGVQSESMLNGISYASKIISTGPGVTRLVTAKIMVNGATVLAGGQYPQDIFTPSASRTLQFSGLTVTRSAIQVWTSEKNNPYTAGARATLDCGSVLGAPFTTDYRWNASFQYAVPPTASQICTAGISYIRTTSKGWVQALGTLRVGVVSLDGLAPQPYEPRARIKYYGTYVTNTPATEVAVGQRIVLTGEPQGISGQTHQWAIGGEAWTTYVAGKGASGHPKASDREQVFFWTKPGQYVVRYTYMLANGANQSADATFNVIGPSISELSYGFNTQTRWPNEIINRINLSEVAKRQVFGNTQYTNALKFEDRPWSGSPSGTTGYRGMNFYVFPPTTNSPKGQFWWTQVVEHSDIFLDGVSTCPIGPGLDNQEIYNPRSPTFVGDGVGTFFDDNVSEVHRSFRATMYLMWKASIGMVPVPLGHITWGFDVTASRSASLTWTTDPIAGTQPSISGVGPDPQFEWSDEYPRWSATLRNYVCPE